MKKLVIAGIVIICSQIFIYGQNTFDVLKLSNTFDYYTAKYTYNRRVISIFDNDLPTKSTNIFKKYIFHIPEVVSFGGYYNLISQPEFLNNKTQKLNDIYILNNLRYSNAFKSGFEKSWVSPGLGKGNIQLNSLLYRPQIENWADDSLFSFNKRLVLNNSEETLTAFEGISTIFMIVPSAFLMFNMHEIGHTFFAKILGDKNAYYVLTRKNENGGRCLGCNEYDPEKLTNTENAIVQLGGIIFSSQVLALSSDLLIRNIYMPKFAQRFFAMTYLTSKLDFTFQIYQCFNRRHDYNFSAQTVFPEGPDIYNFAYYAGIRNQKNYNWMLTGIVTLNIVDIYLSRKQIKRNWQILTGESYYERK